LQNKLILTLKQLQEASAFFLSDSSLRSELRFGQYVWNKFGVKDQTWPALFYEKDAGVAYNMAYGEIR